MCYESLPSSVKEISPKVRFSVGDLHVDGLFSRQMNQKATAQLTPISLARSLQPTNANAAIARLRTFQALADFGVPSDLGTWLATEVSDPSRPERDEPQVVTAFLWLMALPEVLAALESDAFAESWLHSIVEPLIDGGQFDRGMVEQLVEHLGGMTAEAWPA